MRKESFEVLWPVSANNFKAPKRGGGMVKTKEARAYFNNAVLLLRGRFKKLEGPYYRVRLDVYEPNNLRRDIANLEKGVIDSIVKAGLIKDDYLIDDLRIVRNRGKLVKPHGQIIVTIEEIDEKR